VHNSNNKNVSVTSAKSRSEFNNLGDFASSVYRSGIQGRGFDPRLIKNAPTSVGVEGVGEDGGYLVPDDIRTEILSSIMGEDSLLSLCDSHITHSNTFTMPADEVPPWDISNGIIPYWKGENTQLTQSKPDIKEKTVKLNKLTALIPISDELLEDSNSLNAYLRKAVPAKFTSAINLALIQGTGAGEPQGILNCPSLVSIDKESGQSADTLDFANLVNCYSRMYGPLRKNAVWLINQDIEPQLFQMTFEGTSSSIPVYLPASMAGVNSPTPTLFGRPVIPTQACETLGDKGDIIFAAFSEYLVAMKAGGIKEDVSIHLWFDYDVTAFRFTLRLGGQCWWSSTISPRDGSNTMGAFITLDERS